MPGPWFWYVSTSDDNWGYTGEFSTRDEAIREGLRLWPDDEIQICEARMSSAKKYDGEDVVPFTSMRNHEKIAPGLQVLSTDD